jgi:magnesium-transporting ATPase (P-type)
MPSKKDLDNIQKFILHLLAENIAQVCTLLIGLAFKDTRGLSVFPLAPVEILWASHLRHSSRSVLTNAGYHDHFRHARYGLRF